MPSKSPPYPDHECEGCKSGRKLVVTPDNRMACHSPEGWVCMKYMPPKAYAAQRNINFNARPVPQEGGKKV